MNPTQFEWVESELKWTFYELNKSSGKTENYENVFSFKQTQNTLLKQQNTFLKQTELFTLSKGQSKLREGALGPRVGL